jgi:hypothetical protein
MQIQISQISNLLEQKNILLILILVIFVTFAVLYSLTVPALEAPDEGAHYSGIRHMNDKDLDPGRVGKLLDREPIYYVLKSIVIDFFPSEDHLVGTSPWNPDFPHNPAARIHGQEEIFPFEGLSAIVHTLRLFSIIYGLITLIFVYKIGKTVFQNNKWLPLLLTAGVATLPTFVWMNSVINPDSLLWMFSTISIYFLLKFVSTTQYRYIALVAAFAFLAISTKQMGIALYPITVLGIGYFLFSKRLNKIEMIKGLSIFLGITIICFGILFSYNQIESESIQEQTQEESNFTFTGIIKKIPFLSKILVQEPSFERITDPSFVHSRLIKFAISGMGWNSVWAFGIPVDIFFLSSLGSLNYKEYLGSLPYHFLDIFLVLSGIGILFLIKNRKNLDVKLDRHHLFIMFSSIVMVISVVFYNWLFNQVGLMRYTFPIIVCYGVVFTLGWYSVFRQKKLKILLLVPILFFISMNILNIGIIQETFSNDMQDLTADGIIDNIDTNPALFSNNFRHVHNGHETYGSIINRENLDGENQNNISPNFFRISKNNEGIQIMNGHSNESDLLLVKICSDKVIKQIPPESGIIFSCNTQGLDLFKNIGYIPILPYGLVNGDLVQGNDSIQVYLIEDGVKRHITEKSTTVKEYLFGTAFPIKRHIESVSTFNELGYTVEMVKFVPENIIKKIPTSKMILKSSDLKLR